MQGIDRKYPYGIDYNARERISTIENYEITIELWQYIGTNQTGTLIVPTGAAIQKGLYSNNDPAIDDEDALVANADVDGKPTMQAAKTTGGAYIFINTLDDNNGAFTLTGIPNVAAVIFFYIKLKVKDYANLNGYNISYVKELNTESITTGGEFLIDGLKTKKTTNQYITRNGEFMNLFPVLSNKQLTLTSIIIKGSLDQTWQAEIHNNGVLIPGAVLLMNNNTYAAINLNIVIPGNSKIMFYVSGIDIENAQITCFFKG